MFYGGITNRRNQFTYDKIYTSRKNLTDAIGANADYGYNYIVVDANKPDDGVMVGRYVLIQYPDEQYNETYALDNAGITSMGEWHDWNNTVWQKVYLADKLQYILIAELSVGSTIKELQDLLYGKDRQIVQIFDENAPLVETFNANYIYYGSATQTYYTVATDANGNKTLEPLFTTADAQVQEGYNSLLEMALKLRESTDAVTINENQLAIILAPFASVKNNIERKPTGDIMQMTYKSYNVDKKQHTISLNSIETNTDYSIMVASVLFKTAYTYGDTVVIENLVDSTGAPIVYSVYGADGKEAQTGIWQANTAGLISVPVADGDERKLFVNTITPMWS